MNEWLTSSHPSTSFSDRFAKAIYLIALFTGSPIIQKPSSFFYDLQALHLFWKMADAVVSVLLDNLMSILISEGRQLLEFDDQFEETKEELQYMQSYLKVADQVKGRDRNEILKRVMSNLRELVYDTEDVIADCQLLFQKKHEGCAPNFTSYCFPTHLKSRYQLGKRLRKINQGVRKVKENMKSYLQTAPRQPGKDEDGGNMQMTYPILMHEAEMVGLEDDSAKIRKWILEVDGPSTVIGIVGMGGIGKTTLAQKICRSESVKNSFHHLVFVTVSQSFKLDELLKKMLKKLDVKEESLRGMDVEELLESLNRKLDAKYLVVLDDVWQTNEGMWWDSLKSGLPRVEGSCVIITTRNEEVAKSMGAASRHIHYPQTLSKQDSWSLFSKVAFARTGGKCTNPDLEGLGKEIVARCGGLPLTIKVVGGMMQGKSDSIHDWRDISERKELGIDKNDELIISCLELSYEELPTYLKPCFLCFAMFPEDFEIGVQDMVNWWIGEGFVWGENGKTAVEMGKERLSELFNRFLILGVGKDDFERSYVSCKMHDMVRDMVIRIAREESFFVRLDRGGSPAFSEQSRRLGIVRNTAVDSIRNSPTKLRTLAGMDIQSIEMISSLKAKLCEVRWLRVLSLSLSDWNLDGDVVCRDWLSGIGSLQHLVYLNIESSALISLPDSIGNLRNLRILRLQACPNLKRLPVSITTLEKLTAIKIEFQFLECMPEGLGKLSNLERLGWFSPVNKNGSGISELKSLTKLRELRMEIKSVEEIEEGEWNVLSMLQHLQILWLDFEGISVERDGIVKKIEGELSPPLKSLRELYIWEWPGERTPAWLSPTSLPNLQCLFIGGREGRIREMGPRFWDSESGVWKVEVLVLYWIEEMEEEWQRMQRAMPSLRLVKVWECPKLKSFPFDVTVDTWKENKWRKEEEDSGLRLKGVAEEVEEEEAATGAVEEEEKGYKFYSLAREEEGDKFYSFAREEEGTSIQEIFSK
ncbi:disease resistance RPP13-like protein 4 isoform X2 [Magnolia sinica]|uniref:disease resistance RPP13-like protein 4 isoform X2 n=1 Tax=Magnolia sinica TaxID=86752 RepID=UPI002658695B|nr:disease resistance RPP13-like protein 4 isoform X2 [Magnolia sinica]